MRRGDLVKGGLVLMLLPTHRQFVFLFPLQVGAAMAAWMR